MDADEFRKAAHAAIEQIIEYRENVEKLPVLPEVKPGYLAPLIPTEAPQTPESWDQIYPDIASKIIPGLTHWQHPSFMAYFPANTTYPSILGEMYSAAFTAPAFSWICSPACTELETIVMDWLAKALDLPANYLSTGNGGGVIQGSASEAIATCAVAARERYLRRKCDAEGLSDPSPEREKRTAVLRGKLIALSSDQSHSSTHKGANIAGTLYRPIKTQFSNELSLQASELESALEQVTAEGLEPYYVTINFGATNTCAIDDFAGLEPVLKRYPNMWVHIDAAYVGTALVCPEYSKRYSHLMSIGDSFNANLSKWLLVNFDASCMWIQNRRDLTSALSITPAYLQNQFSDSGVVTDYRDWSLALGRRFRALKIWFTMRSYGIEGLQQHIRRTTALGDLFADLVRKRSDLYEFVVEPSFALTCFRIKPEIIPQQVITTGSTKETTANQLSKKIVEIINDSREFFLTATTTQDKSFVRVVVGTEQAKEEYMHKVFDRIVEVTNELLGNVTNGTNGTH